MIPVIGMVLFTVSCKKEDVTKLSGTNPTASASSIATSSKMVPNTPDEVPPTPQMYVIAPTYTTAILTYSDYKGNHQVKVTNMNGKYLYDIDADGTIDYQIVPKISGDLSKVQCFDVAGKLLGETTLAINSSNKSATIKTVTPDYAATPSIIYNSRDKSFSSWKSCVENFSSSVYGISGAVAAGFGGPWGVAAYYGGIGLGCYFKDLYTNYRSSIGSIKCSNVVTEYASTISSNTVTVNTKTAVTKTY